MKRKWREIHSLYFLIIYFFSIPLHPFPISKIVSFCRKMLKRALLSRMSQKTYHMRYEKIFLGRIRCEKAAQVVPACFVIIIN